MDRPLLDGLLAGRRPAGVRARPRGAVPRRGPRRLRRRRRLDVRRDGRARGGAADVRRADRARSPGRPPAVPDRVRRARAVPDLGVRAGAGVRPDPRRRVRLVRSGRARDRPDAGDGRYPAPGRARRHRPRAAVRDGGPARSPPPSSNAGTRSTSCSPTRASTTPRGPTRRSWPPGRRWRMPPPSRCCATTWRAGWSSPTIGSATVAGRLFATEDLQGAVQSFLTDGPGRASFHGR